MKRLKNRSSKGRRLEKVFAEELKKIYPHAETEFKPRIINLKKDFWGLFDGLTFIRNKKIFIFWQIKGTQVSNKIKIGFWRQAKNFQSKNIFILFIEKTKNTWRIFYQPQKYISSLKELKRLLR